MNHSALRACKALQKLILNRVMGTNIRRYNLNKCFIDTFHPSRLKPVGYRENTVNIQLNIKSLKTFDTKQGTISETYAHFLFEVHPNSLNKYTNYHTKYPNFFHLSTVQN